MLKVLSMYFIVSSVVMQPAHTRILAETTAVQAKSSMVSLSLHM